jgi:hypothetical protein
MKENMAKKVLRKYKRLCDIFNTWYLQNSYKTVEQGKKERKMQNERPRQKRQEGESLCKMGGVDIIARRKKKERILQNLSETPFIPNNPMTLDNGLGPFALGDDGHTKTTVRTLQN